MTINSYKVGPGTFTIGSGPTAFSSQVRSMLVEASENVETEDDLPVLSGEVLEGEDTATLDWQLSGTFLQDLATNGIIDYTWTNASEEQTFTYVPLTSADKAVTGTCRIVPISVGGEAKQRATSDFTWAIIGTPTFGDATP